MPSRIEDIKQTLSDISRNKSLLDYLIEIERTLSELEVFTYANWEIGELVSGPDVQRHWVITEWMFPDLKMPDPNAGLRIEKIGGKVSFRKDVFTRPSKVHTLSISDDIKTSESAEMVDHKVWVVTIALPVSYVSSNPVADEVEQDAEDNDDIADAYSADIPDAQADGEVDDLGDEYAPQ